MHFYFKPQTKSFNKINAEHDQWCFMRRKTMLTAVTDKQWSMFWMNVR